MVRSFRKQVVDSLVLGRGDLKLTTPNSLRLRTDVLGTGIEKEKDEEEEVEEEDVNGEEEYPDLLACRPCGLVFAPAWGLKDHQIRGCLVDERPSFGK
jgi:hypothetical protein